MACYIFYITAEKAKKLFQPSNILIERGNLMKTKIAIHETFKLRFRSGVRSGNAASDACYANRNFSNLLNLCDITGECYPELSLKHCLAASGEPLWWKDFPDMNQDKACKITASHLDTKPEYRGKDGLLPKMGCSLKYWGDPDSRVADDRF